MNSLFLFLDNFNFRTFLSDLGLWIGVGILLFVWLNERFHRKVLGAKMDKLERIYEEILRELVKKN